MKREIMSGLGKGSCYDDQGDIDLSGLTHEAEEAMGALRSVRKNIMYYTAIRGVIPQEEKSRHEWVREELSFLESREQECKTSFLPPSWRARFAAGTTYLHPDIGVGNLS